jgi:hypothetical protein
VPISDIQAKVLKRIAANRSPESYLAGATVLHRADDSPRFSQDLDFFHDVEDSIALSAEKDAETLRQAGYDFAWLLRTPTFHRAIVTAGKQQLKMEWAQDSAFRFFPVQKDKYCGYRLHDADAAINKILALAGRNEIRDFVDVLHLHKTYLSVGAMAWAACGKDPGFTPELLLDQAGRHTAHTQADLDRLDLRIPLNLRTMKQNWFAALDEALTLIASLPPDEMGCLYLGPGQCPMTPNPTSGGFRTLTRHKGCVRGAWPSISPYPATKATNEDTAPAAEGE